MQQICLLLVHCCDSRVCFAANAQNVNDGCAFLKEQIMVSGCWKLCIMECNVLKIRAILPVFPLNNSSEAKSFFFGYETKCQSGKPYASVPDKMFRHERH